jgi:hypothetical protein
MARTLEPPWSGRCAVVLMDRCRTTWGLALRRGRRRQARRRAVAQRRDEDGHRRWFGTSCREGETRSVSRAGPGSVSGSRRSARRSTSRPMTAGTALSRGGATRPRGACSCSEALVEARMVRSPSGPPPSMNSSTLCGEALDGTGALRRRRMRAGRARTSSGRRLGVPVLGKRTGAGVPHRSSRGGDDCHARFVTRTTPSGEASP